MMENLKKQYLATNLELVMSHGPVIVDYWVSFLVYRYNIFAKVLSDEKFCRTILHFEKFIIASTNSQIRYP